MNSPARHDRRQTQMGREAACLSELSKEEVEDAFAQEQRWSHRGLLEEGPHTIPKEWSRGTLKRELRMPWAPGKMANRDGEASSL